MMVYPASRPWYDIRDFKAQPSASVDQTGPIQATIATAAANGGGQVFIPPGTWRIATALSRLRTVSLIGAGEEATILQFDDVGGFGIDTPLPSWTLLSPTVDVNIGDRTLTFADASAVVDGSDVYLRDSSTNDAAGAGTTYHGSFIGRVQSHTPTVVTLEESCPVNLTVSKAVTAQFFSTPLESGPVIRDMTLQVAGGVIATNRATLLRMVLARAGVIERVRARYAQISGIRLEECLGSLISTCAVEHVGGGGTGIEIIDCTATEAAHNHVNDSPFGIVATSSPYTDIHDNTSFGRSLLSNGRGIKCQCGSYYSKIHNNTVSDHALMGCAVFDSPGTSIRGNKVFNCGATTADLGIDAGGYTANTWEYVVSDNEVYGSAGYGIQLSSTPLGGATPGVRCSDNIIRNCHDGLLCQIYGAEISNNYFDTLIAFRNAISVANGAGGCKIHNNTCDYSAGTGINTVSSAGANDIRDNVMVDRVSPGFPPAYSLHALDRFEPTIEVFALTYGTTVNTDASLGKLLTLAVANTTAFTMAAPTNATSGREIEYEFLNSSGGAMGVVTWNVAFKLAGAFTNPANGLRRTITFRYNGTNWIEKNRAAADI